MVSLYSYVMRLAGEHGWRIVASKGAVCWVEKLASIMCLERIYQPNDLPRLIFILNESGEDADWDPICGLDPNIRANLPRSGWKKALPFWSHRDVPDLICEFRYLEVHPLSVLEMMDALTPIYHRVQASGGLPFHAGLVEWNGTGVLLAARGGTGKSTCCRRLPRPWRALCDDETLIVRDDQKRYLAHPFPTWSEYLRFQRSERTWNVQQYVPLNAIFFLEQAETDEVVPIGQGQAAILSNQSATQVQRRSWKNLNREEQWALKKGLFDNACELAKTIPAFILRVSLSGRFWEEMEKVL